MRVMFIVIMSFALLSCKSLIADPEPLDARVKSTIVNSYFIEKNISTGLVRNSTGNIDPSFELSTWLKQMKAGLDERLAILSDAELSEKTKENISRVWSKYNGSKVHFVVKSNNKSETEYEINARLYRFSLKIADCQNRKGQYRLGCATEINRQLSRYSVNPVRELGSTTSPALYEQVPVSREIQFTKPPWISDREDRK